MGNRELLEAMEAVEEHIKKQEEYIKKLETARDMLGYLTYHLLRNYEDEQWSSSTRELLEEANDYLGEQPIVWNIDDEPDYSAEMPEGYVREPR